MSQTYCQFPSQYCPFLAIIIWQIHVFATWSFTLFKKFFLHTKYFNMLCPIITKHLTRFEHPCQVQALSFAPSSIANINIFSTWTFWLTHMSFFKKWFLWLPLFELTTIFSFVFTPFPKFCQHWQFICPTCC